MTAIDDVRMDDLEIRATQDGAGGNLIRTGGDANLLTNNTNYASMSSGTAPATPTDVDDQNGNPITQFVTNEFAIVNVLYTVPTAAPFVVDEGVSFSGGATGIVISDNGINSLQVFLTDGAIGEVTGTATGGTSGNTATVSSATFSSESTQPFSLTETTGGGTPTWTNAETSVDINNNVTNTNAALGATSPGLYSFDLFLNAGSCDSEALRVNTLIYNDLNDDYERTFIDQTYVESDSRDTIFLSNPANHTVNVSGTGITVTDPLASRLLILFDPEIAGSVNSPFTISYQITNDITNESITLTSEFTVNPVTEFFDPVPDEERCFDELPLSLTLDDTQYGPNLATDLQFQQFIFQDVTNGSTFGFFFVTAASIGTNHPWDTPFNVTPSGDETGGVSGTDFYFNNPLDAERAGEASTVIVARDSEDPNTGDFIQDYDYLFFYGDPLVSISNVVDNYCEDEADFTLQRNLRYVSSFTADNPDDDITSWKRNYTEATHKDIAKGYKLERWDGGTFVAYPITGAPINTLNPS